MKENIMATNFEPHEHVIFVQSTKIGTHENKAIHSIKENYWTLLLQAFQNFPAYHDIEIYEQAMKVERCWNMQGIYNHL